MIKSYNVSDGLRRGRVVPFFQPKVAGVAKSADARDLKSLGGNTVPVQVRSPAPECLCLRDQGH